MKSVSMVIRSRVENQKKLASSNLINLRTYVIETKEKFYDCFLFSFAYNKIPAAKAVSSLFFFPFSRYIYILVQQLRPCSILNANYFCL